MTYTFTTKLIAEFIATAMLIILGNGSVANVELKGTKGHASGWLTIAVGYGMGGDVAGYDFRRYFRQPHQPCFFDWFGRKRPVSLGGSRSVYHCAATGCYVRPIGCVCHLQTVL